MVVNRSGKRVRGDGYCLDDEARLLVHSDGSDVSAGSGRRVVHRFVHHDREHGSSRPAGTGVKTQKTGHCRHRKVAGDDKLRAVDRCTVSFDWNHLPGLSVQNLIENHPFGGCSKSTHSSIVGRFSPQKPDNRRKSDEILPKTRHQVWNGVTTRRI